MNALMHATAACGDKADLDSILAVPSGRPAPAFAADDAILVISNRPDFPAS
ncbi:MAG: hypothetical protein WCP35_05640 [Verrucomicrobiota bacterium]